MNYFFLNKENLKMEMKLPYSIGNQKQLIPSKFVPRSTNKVHPNNSSKSLICENRPNFCQVT